MSGYLPRSSDHNAGSGRRRLVSAGWCVGALGLIVSKYGIDAVIGVDVSDRHRATEPPRTPKI